jgi:hypothetical protein
MLMNVEISILEAWKNRWVPTHWMHHIFAADGAVGMGRGLEPLENSGSVMVFQARSV